MDLVECRQVASTGAEYVIFDIAVEVPQRPAYDIRRLERIALVFTVADDMLPIAVALRVDFPWVPHVNLVGTPGPRQLCLYDQAWSEVRLRLTGARLLERVREWLNLTARGQLHAEDQALEPFLLGAAVPVVLPFDPRSRPATDDPVPLRLRKINAGLARHVLRAVETDAAFSGEHGTAVVATIIRAHPRRHGLVHYQPRTLEELHGFLREGGTNLLQELRDRLRRSQPWRARKVLRTPLLLLVLLPKWRGDGDGIEDIETWAFLCVQSVAEIGVALGSWEIRRGVPQPVAQTLETNRAGNIKLHVLNPLSALTRELAARYNGLTEPGTSRVAAIGMGALGSQVFINLLRSGWGEWTLIDSDYLLPHNLARQSLLGPSVGAAKSDALAQIANDMIDGPPMAQSIVADVLDPREAADMLLAIWGDTDLILDTSASVAVARHLASEVSSQGRRMSLFLNPTGTDLVLLAEDAARTIPLDLLEQQYYRLVAETPQLAAHLRSAEGRIRYARSCRDVSATIPQDLAALHAAIGSRAIKQAMVSAEASIVVWRAEPKAMTVVRIESVATPLVEWTLGNWTLRTDSALLKKIARARDKKLPNETGGVLIGAFDVPRKIVYAIDTLPSPSDSVEWPTLYIRGRQGLKDEVTRIGQVTGGMLEYVGEWHSHPHGHGVAPSADDLTVLTWLVEMMRIDGLPALMLIAGDEGQWGWHVRDFVGE